MVMHIHELKTFHKQNLFSVSILENVIVKSQDIAKISTKQKRPLYTNFKKAFLQIKLLRFIISRVVEFIIVYNLTTTGAALIGID